MRRNGIRRVVSQKHLPVDARQFAHGADLIKKVGDAFIKLHICALQNSVGMPGIEPGFYAPEAYVIPLYHIPTRFLNVLTILAQNKTGAPSRARTWDLTRVRGA